MSESNRSGNYIVLPAGEDTTKYPNVTMVIERCELDGIYTFIESVSLGGGDSVVATTTNRAEPMLVELDIGLRIRLSPDSLFSEKVSASYATDYILPPAHEEKTRAQLAVALLDSFSESIKQCVTKSVIKLNALKTRR